MCCAETIPTVVLEFQSDVRSLGKLIPQSPTQSANPAVFIFVLCGFLDKSAFLQTFLYVVLMKHICHCTCSFVFAFFPLMRSFLDLETDLIRR